jgi:hypothetical protein
MIRPVSRLSALLLTVAACPLGAQQLHLHNFADLRFRTAATGADHSSFALGQYDMHVTAQLPDHVSFLSEVVFESSNGEFGADVERLIATWTPDPHFSLGIGKHHTPFGYWSNAFHHGELLQPTIGRPLLYLFEDDGGPLPIHTVGLEASGRDLTAFHLGFDALIGNGIGSDPTQDNDGNKSVSVGLYSQVTSRLRVGGSVYFDRVSRGVINLAGNPVTAPISVRMYGGYLAFTGTSLELIGEFQQTRHDDGSGPRTTRGYVGYAGYRLGNVVPYVRYDRIDYPATDPWFAPLDWWFGGVGLRYDMGAHAVVKLEGRRRSLQGDRVRNQFAAQFAVGF